MYRTQPGIIKTLLLQRLAQELNSWLESGRGWSYLPAMGGPGQSAACPRTRGPERLGGSELALCSATRRPPRRSPARFEFLGNAQEVRCAAVGGRSAVAVLPAREVVDVHVRRQWGEASQDETPGESWPASQSDPRSRFASRTTAFFSSGLITRPADRWVARTRSSSDSFRGDDDPAAPRAAIGMTRDTRR